MKVLVKDKWQDGFLDQTLMPNMVRIYPIQWLALESVSNVYYVRPKSIRMLYNYVKQIGVVEVMRKIISRLQEAVRNDKYISCGYGVTDNNEPVLFIAPLHPKCMERIVLPQQLVKYTSQTLKNNNVINYYDLTQRSTADMWWQSIKGWSEFSGAILNDEMLAQLFTHVATELQRLAQPTSLLACDDNIIEHTTAVKNKNTLKKAVLFGLGNMAKTRIIPAIEKYVDLRVIHECDITQIPQNVRAKHFGYDTSPVARLNDHYEVYFIAGYHHTHVQHALAALAQDAYAVVEKPLATNQHDLELILAALTKNPHKMFVCFQKRYLAFNDYICQDLGAKKGEPLDYYCIVYEEPLPALHWYRWPNSGSRIISNACHWVDHFLFLNDYVDVKKYHLEVSANDTTLISIELVNGALFSMVLTEIGSNRIGLNEIIDIRRPGAQARIINSSSYVAESSTKVIRRTKVDKLAVYTTMYQTIAQKIYAGAAGDSKVSIEATSALVLALEQQYQQQIRVRS